MSNNLKDIELLRTNPNQFILELQNLIDIIVKQFINGGSFASGDLEEIKQQVNEELLKKIIKIRDQFKGKSMLRTYMSAVIRNICNELIRKENRIKYVYLEEISVKETGSETMNFLHFEDEVTRLKKVIDFYIKQKPKIILCLKLRFKLPFDFDDFKNAIPDISHADFSDFLTLVAPYQKSTDNKIIEGLTRLLNKYEGKNKTPDALRKWIMSVVNELIDVLNGSSNTYQYNEETFQILFEYSLFNERDMAFKTL